MSERAERYPTRTRTLAQDMAELARLYDLVFYVDDEERISVLAVDHCDSTDVSIVGEGL